VGTTHDGHHRGILFPEEITQIITHGLVYPIPWPQDRCEAEIPEKFESANGLFDISIPAWAEQGYVIGLASGVFDVLHAGHLRFLNACRENCDVLILGVDGNRLVEHQKGPHRPYNDFPVRVGTLSELESVNYLIRVPELAVWLGFPTPYLIFPYVEFGREHIFADPRLLEDAVKQFKQSWPGWHERVGPNLRFFWSEDDPHEEVKRLGARLFGARPVVFPRFTTLSSTEIAQHFGLRKPDTHQNKFGVEPHWMRPYTRRASELFNLSSPS
jgi:cytidyltransferase-like protein